MPGPVGISTAEGRRWASRIDQIVTDNGANIDFHGTEEERILSDDELREVTDNDVITLLTPAVERINANGCWDLTDASLTAVAANCPNLVELTIGSERVTDASIRAVTRHCLKLSRLQLCGCNEITDIGAENCPNLQWLMTLHCIKLTDASITAVADHCPNLMVLAVAWCTKLTDASIAAVAAGCPNLKALMLDGSTKLTKVSLAAIASSFPNLERLFLCDCRFTALPENIGNLSKLRFLDAGRNLLTGLPLSIVQLDDSCTLQLDGNPLQTPPSEIAEQGLPAIRRYFEQRAAISTQSSEGISA